MRTIHISFSENWYRSHTEIFWTDDTTVPKEQTELISLKKVRESQLSSKGRSNLPHLWRENWKSHLFLNTLKNSIPKRWLCNMQGHFASNLRKFLNQVGAWRIHRFKRQTNKNLFTAAPDDPAATDWTTKICSSEWALARIILTTDKTGGMTWY